jgi:hypothetical protein
MEGNMKKLQTTKHKSLKLAVLALLLIFNTSVNANQTDSSDFSNSSHTNEVIKDSYIVTFKQNASIVKKINKLNKGFAKVPFGTHSTGQSKKEISDKIKLKGKVVSIYETINAVHVEMNLKEAERLGQDERILSIEKNIILHFSTIQNNPGWALDRTDEITPSLNNQYDYGFTGNGRTIYFLDSGLDLGNQVVADEFGGRASVFFDINGGTGADCLGHGTQVTSAAAGNIYGVAKGATVRMVKVSNGCTGNIQSNVEINALNWFAANSPRGTIVSISINVWGGNNCTPYSNTALENAVRAAHDAGIIVVYSAGNDGCSVDDFSPTNIPEAFVVGATSNIGFPVADRLWDSSRAGWNISTFAPGGDVRLMNFNGNQVVVSGTSFSAPYVAGIFAVVCEVAGTACSILPTPTIYQAMRDVARVNTVTDSDGTPLTGAFSRFITQEW